jgi:hypothetical protein
MPADSRYNCRLMRLTLAIVLAAGCIRQPDPLPPDPGWTGPQGDPLFGCASDADCGSEVCARDDQCYPATSIRVAHALWTIRGEPAGVASCAGQPDLYIQFLGSNGGEFGFAPVPCTTGKFTVDKLPTIYTQVELGADDTDVGTTAVIDEVTGEATIDLP